jgi:GT2 family glycosyltransferase
VDHEMCLRLRSLGWQIWVDPHRIIHHEIGEDSRLVGGRVRISKHSLQRRREMWRNTIFVMQTYWWKYPRDCSIHFLVRLAETAAGAWYYREPRYLSRAVEGGGAGLRTRHRRAT